MIVQLYYISTGAKNAMYTLWMTRLDPQATYAQNHVMYHHTYLTNLAATAELAIEKAELYVEAIRQRIGERDDFKIELDPDPDSVTIRRRGNLSVRDTQNLICIEEGKFPFGKHKDQQIENAPERYILYWADQHSEESDNIVIQTLSSICMGIALERGYIAARDKRREEKYEQESKSNFIGNIGERLELKGVLYEKWEKGNDFDGFYFLNKVRINDNIVVYTGKSLGEVGQEIAFKATIKQHNEYKGIKSTKVNRPMSVRVCLQEN